MRRKTYRVLPRGKGWGGKLSGSWITVTNAAGDRASLLDKETYTAAVKKLARENPPSTVIVHNRDGLSRVVYGRYVGRLMRA